MTPIEVAVAEARATARSPCQPLELKKQAVLADVRALVLVAAEREALRASSGRPARSLFLTVLLTPTDNAMHVSNRRPAGSPGTHAAAPRRSPCSSFMRGMTMPSGCTCVCTCLRRRTGGSQSTATLGPLVRGWGFASQVRCLANIIAVNGSWRVSLRGNALLLASDLYSYWTLDAILRARELAGAPWKGSPRCTSWLRDFSCCVAFLP